MAYNPNLYSEERGCEDCPHVKAANGEWAKMPICYKEPTPEQLKPVKRKKRKIKRRKIKVIKK